MRWPRASLALILFACRPLGAEPAARLDMPELVAPAAPISPFSSSVLPPGALLPRALLPALAVAPAEIKPAVAVRSLALAAAPAARKNQPGAVPSVFDGGGSFALAQALAPVIVSVLTPELRIGMWRKLKEPGPAGHCYAASEALYHLLGGKRAGWTPVVGPGVAMRGLPAGTHRFLRYNLTGQILDATAAQFPKPYRYERGRGSGFMTKGPSRRAAEIIRRVKAVLADRLAAAGIHPERTAPSRGGLSVPARLALPLMRGDVLDYGAGRGEDARFLRKKGLRVAAYDPYYFPQKPPQGKRFDWAMLNYVLNVIPSPSERDAALKDAAERLKPGGRLVVAVRGRREIDYFRSSEWKRHGDGWITPHDTFQHGYTPEELRARLAENGLTVVKSLDPLIVIAKKAGKPARFGKETPSALYFHRSLEGAAPPRLRAVVARARKLLPSGARWNIIKVAHDGSAVSFLRYPDFDKDPHPALSYVYRVDLKRRRLTQDDQGRRANPFILHRKDSFVAPDYPGYAGFRALTEKEEAAGLLGRSDIGTRDDWRRALRAQKDR